MAKDIIKCYWFQQQQQITNQMQQQQTAKFNQQANPTRIAFIICGIVTLSLCDKLFAVHLLSLVSYSAPLRFVYNIIDFVQHEYKLGQLFRLSISCCCACCACAYCDIAACVRPVIIPELIANDGTPLSLFFNT